MGFWPKRKKGIKRASFHSCDGNIIAEKYTEILEQHTETLIFKIKYFAGMQIHVSSRQCKTTTCTHYKDWGRRGYGNWTGLPTVLTCPQQRMLENFETNNMTTLYCCTFYNIVGRKGQGNTQNFTSLCILNAKVLWEGMAAWRSGKSLTVPTFLEGDAGLKCKSPWILTDKEKLVRTNMTYLGFILSEKK